MNYILIDSVALKLLFLEQKITSKYMKVWELVFQNFSEMASKRLVEIRVTAYGRRVKSVGIKDVASTEKRDMVSVSRV